MTKFTVIGAGMAGLLAASVLREECAHVIEAQPDLPNNHSALLRFRSSIVGDTLNIPFKPVQVIKAVATLGNPVADAISYSLKTNGTARLRSIITAQGATEQRYIAPPDYIEAVRRKVTAPIHFNEKWDGKSDGVAPVISTLPMPTLMKMLDYCHGQEFKSIEGWTCTAKLRNTDLCATIYIPAPGEMAYRASITGDQLIVEYAFPGLAETEARERMAHLTDYPKNAHDHLHWVLSLFGMTSGAIIGKPKFKRQHYAKILPVDADARKRFMLWATEQHNIYSFGRFATWRPGLLQDDLINDLRVIQRLANGGTSYDARRVS